MIRLYTIFLFFIFISSSCHKSQSNSCCDTHYVNEEWNGHQILIPNAFSPNGDGINDRFEVRSDSTIRTISLTILNGPVTIEEFHSSTLEQDDIVWNGYSYPEGKYFYKAVIMDSTGNQKEYVGTVCLYKTSCPSENCKFPIGFFTPESGQFICR